MPPLRPAAPIENPPTVLVVDDNEAVLSSLRFSFQVEGMTVRTFRSASEILAESSLPDSGCLVIDLKLEDEDGLNLLAELRRRGIKLPAILITSGPSEATRRRAAAFGVAIVEKPSLGNGLTDAVLSAVSAPR